MYSVCISSKYITVKCPTTPWFIPLSIISIIFLSLIFASSKNMKSHLAKSREFFSRARKQSSVRIESVCKYIRSAFGGWQVQRGGRRETELSRATRISVSIFHEWQRTSGACARLTPCFALGEPSLVSIAQSRFMELDVEGTVIKYAGMHAEGIVAISPYYPIRGRSNSSKKSNLEFLIVKIRMPWTLIYVKNKIYYLVKGKVFYLSKLKIRTGKLY